MKKASFLTVLLLFFCVLLSFAEGVIVKAEPRTIVVPDDYSSIQEAIDNAAEGDTVYVNKGTYNETVEINRSLSLIGEDSETTIMAGFRLDYGNPPPVINIKAPKVNISGFTLTGSGNAGIWIEIRDINIEKSGFNITRNKIMNNGLAIRTYDVSNCIISDNNINRNGDGIHFVGSDSTISRNNISGNGTGEGIEVDFSQNVTISENQISGNKDGIYLYYIRQNEPIYIYENNITTNNNGIRFWYDCSNSIIYKNSITSNDVGIYLENVIYTDRVGMNNQIFTNNIVDNTQQVLIDPLSNIVSWDNGTYGNYWSDYNGTDSDGNGIGDTPHIIDQNNQDNYPLIKPVIIPEFPSWTPLLVTLTFVITVSIIFRSKMRKPKGGSKEE